MLSKLNMSTLTRLADHSDITLKTPDLGIGSIESDIILLKVIEG